MNIRSRVGLICNLVACGGALSLPLHAFAQSPRLASFAAPLVIAADPPAGGAAAAQPKAIVEGVILDPQGMPVAGATVMLVHDGLLAASTTTGDTGQFLLRQSAGLYTLTATAPQMASNEQAVELQPGQTVHLDCRLQMAQLSTTVTVVDSGYQEPDQSAASRVPMRILDIPQTVDTISVEMMRDRAVSSMQEALAYTPSVTQIMGEGRRDQFSIRGMNAQNDVFLDGVRDDSGYYRDLSNTERLEVVEGPAAVLYGRGGSGGIINRVSKQPRMEGSLSELAITVGSYGSRRLQGDMDTVPGTHKLGFRSTGAWETGGSFRHLYELNRYAYAPSLRWKPSANQDVLIQFDRLRDERIPDRGITALNGRPAPVADGTYYGYATKGGTVGPDFIHSTVTGMTVDWQGRLGAWTAREHFRRTGYANALQNTFASATSGTLVTRSEYDSTQLQKNYFNQVDAWRAFQLWGMRHQLLAGFEYGHQSSLTRRYTGTAASVDLYNPAQIAPVLGKSPTQNTLFTGLVWAGYVQDQIQIAPRWKALIGLRLDDYRQSDQQIINPALSSSRRDTQPSPRVGLLYQPNQSTTYYGSWSHTFHPSGEGLSLTVATSNNTGKLAPETTDNYELGAKYSLLGGRMAASAAVYRLNRTNVRVPDYTADPAGTIYVNGGRQRTDGLAAGFSGRINSHWRTTGSWAWMNAWYPYNPTRSSGIALTGNQAQMVPRHSGSLWQMYESHSGFGAGLGVVAMTARFASTTNLVTIPGYARIDATAAYRTRRWDLDLHLENLTNAHIYASAQGDNQIMPGSPITAKATLRWRF